MYTCLERNFFNLGFLVGRRGSGRAVARAPCNSWREDSITWKGSRQFASTLMDMGIWSPHMYQANSSIFMSLGVVLEKDDTANLDSHIIWMCGAGSYMQITIGWHSVSGRVYRHSSQYFDAVLACAYRKANIYGKTVRDPSGVEAAMCAINPA